ncbi:uncharacterized protein MP3633_2298 [Marinomonas primoryensis]|uniref:Uncharacterized protein n=1 Tax=Marinomonas primoryensis TaxID=178399 RepID=A0A859CWG3_9GAMM|nr:uncharacterized protein MP3633_2298 [Marinomonas primoryensis]
MSESSAFVCQKVVALFIRIQRVNWVKIDFLSQLSKKS